MRLVTALRQELHDPSTEPAAGRCPLRPVTADRYSCSAFDRVLSASENPASSLLLSAIPSASSSESLPPRTALRANTKARSCNVSRGILWAPCSRERPHGRDDTAALSETTAQASAEICMTSNAAPSCHRPTLCSPGRCAIFQILPIARNSRRAWRWQRSQQEVLLLSCPRVPASHAVSGLADCTCFAQQLADRGALV